jgi:hypothetical protein
VQPYRDAGGLHRFPYHPHHFVGQSVNVCLIRNPHDAFRGVQPPGLERLLPPRSLQNRHSRPLSRHSCPLSSFPRGLSPRKRGAGIHRGRSSAPPIGSDLPDYVSVPKRCREGFQRLSRIGGNRRIDGLSSTEPIGTWNFLPSSAIFLQIRRKNGELTCGLEPLSCSLRVRCSIANDAGCVSFLSAL